MLLPNRFGHHPKRSIGREKGREKGISPICYPLFSSQFIFGLIPFLVPMALMSARIPCTVMPLRVLFEESLQPGRAFFGSAIRLRKALVLETNLLLTVLTNSTILFVQFVPML